MGIRIIKEKRPRDYTFVDPNLELKSLPTRADKTSRKHEREFRTLGNPKVSKLKKPRMTGGHGMQGHSPVYE